MTQAHRNYLDNAHISLCCMHFNHVAMTTTCFFIHPSSSHQTPIIGCSAVLVLLQATATSQRHQRILEYSKNANCSVCIDNGGMARRSEKKNSV